MFLFRSKKTSKLTNIEREKILNLKNRFWNKGIKSQKIWFKENIKSLDTHNLLFLNKKLIGYTCLRYRSVLIKKKLSKYLLFDTLVIDKNNRKKGLGSILMAFNNMIIKNYNLPSFLVCEKKTINFYKKNKWKLLNKKLILIKDKDYGLKTIMVYSCDFQSKLNLWFDK